MIGVEIAAIPGVRERLPVHLAAVHAAQPTRPKLPHRPWIGGQP